MPTSAPATGFELESERLSLRPAGEAELDGLERILADPEIYKMLLGDVSTPEGIRKEALKWIDPDAIWQAHGFGSWGIFDRYGAFGVAGDLLGIAAASPPLPGIGAGPEIFYFVRRDRACRGVAGEAVARMCRHLFEDLGAPALEASIFAELNPGSVGLAQKLGMRLCGRISLRDHGLGDERIQEIVDFDLWRVRTAPQERLPETPSEAAFRIGQTLAEGLGDQDGGKAALIAALGGRDLAPEGRVEAALIDRRLAEGRAAKGLALYRVTRQDFVG